MLSLLLDLFTHSFYTNEVLSYLISVSVKFFQNLPYGHPSTQIYS